MLHNDVLVILERDLLKLKEEISLYKNTDDLWVVAPGTSNSGGNLALHLVGNLRHFIGAVLGNSDYVRDRDSEFSSKNLSAGDLMNLIDTAHMDVANALKNLDPSKLSEEFPKDIGGKKMDTAYVLLHLLVHLGYHLGQINYHRRIISSPER